MTQRLTPLILKPDEECRLCNKEFYGKAGRYNLDIHMQHIHPAEPWVPLPRKLKKKQRSSGNLKAKGLYPLPEESKVVALALLNITESIEQTVELTGIPGETLRQWQKADDDNKRKRKNKGRTFGSKVESFVERMMQLMLIRSSQYTPEQMMKATALIAGLVPNLKVSLPKPVATPPPAAAPQPIEPVSSPSDDTLAAYERMITAIMEQSRTTEEPLTRAQVIDIICAQNPEARPYLKPEPVQEYDEPTESVS